MDRIFNKSTLLIALLSLPFLSQAAETAPKGGNSINVVLVSLVTLIFVLLIVIGILGNVLRQLGFVYLDRIKAQRKSGVSAKAILLLISFGGLSLSANAQAAVDTAQAAAPLFPSSYSGIQATEFYFLVGTIAFELLIITALILSIRTIVKLLSAKPETKKVVEAIVRRSFWEKFHNMAAADKEEEIILDHDYDGIKELDNNLPAWWKYGFYVTILVAFVYMYYYHFGGGGQSSLQEYAAEVAKGEADKEAYLAKSSSNVDENTVKLLDAAGIAAGQVTFQNMCAACHAKDGGGGVGPNLTDEYWLHGGSLSDVFKSIKYGWADKGMKSWKDDFSPKQIAELASYVKSLKGSKPAVPKEKQGELYTEEGVKTDSAQVAMVK
ncbi:cbb3-type cytochrome c oxidase N-terminal domain-containing protein [Polluticoccus soli]|uniref:cbb3-type cytochrome c oxidase N-terminal domain-containing protein n=1 Tax=Polluticoccus soli TaxID=3034150 RepID=UPI0023E0B925|nr:cbb3-type cytochrome c oxidase N-terminal domain-containing protein [Flavipsychrobacter sp. JY13-12]